MNALTRAAAIRAADHGYAYEEALADPNTNSYTYVSADILPGELQQPDYTRSVLGTFAAIGYTVDDRHWQEPRKRPIRSTALMEDVEIAKTLIMPDSALRMRVGSAAITLDNLQYVRETAEEAIGRKDLTLAVYRKPEAKVFDPPTMFIDGGYIVTGSRDGGRRVFVDDGAIEVKTDDTTFSICTTTTAILLNRPDTLTGAEALAEVDSAIEELTRTG